MPTPDVQTNVTVNNEIELNRDALIKRTVSEMRKALAEEKELVSQ